MHQVLAFLTGSCEGQLTVYPVTPRCKVLQTFRENSSDLIFGAVLFIPCNNSAVSWGIYGGQESCTDRLYRTRLYASLQDLPLNVEERASQEKNVTLAKRKAKHCKSKYTTLHFCINWHVSEQCLSVGELRLTSLGEVSGYLCCWLQRQPQRTF